LLLPIGTGCGGTPAALVGSGPPTFDSIGTLFIAHEPGAFGGLYLSAFHPTGDYFTPLGCLTVYLDLATIQLVTPFTCDAGGQAAFTTHFPADPLFAGFGVDVQALVFGSPSGFATSNAVRLIIGS
jgi:hypothetical protein